MQVNFFEKLIGSGLFTGYIPIASGTFGSMVGAAVYYIPGFEKPEIIIPAIVLFFFYGVYIGNKFEKLYGKDPAECTIDEVVGTWIAFLFLPKSIFITLLAFFVWRIMDVIKPYPARKLESLNGGLGIMIDDVISGLYSLAIVHIILIILNIK